MKEFTVNTSNLRNRASSSRRLVLKSALALSSSISSSALWAADDKFPSKPIKVLVGFPPGGAIDLIMRSVAIEASKKLGQPLMIENRSGASGAVAYTALKNSPPDGYTIAPVTITAFRAPVLEDVSFDPLQDFQYLAGITDIPFGVVVREDSPFKTWKDLLAWGRANPNQMMYGAAAGLGNTSHLFVEEVAAKENLKWTPIPFRGTTDCIQALLGGQIVFTVDTIAGTAALVKGGKLRILAVATDARLPSWPQIQTMRELGSAISVNNLWGVAGPKGLDPQVASTLEAAFKFAMEQPSVISLLQSVEQKPLYTDGKSFRAFAEKSVKEQKEVLTKYGFAKK
jgi:tripartite-type tricarboxylate transporter receptor subunit TctC